ncbi:hypothetical protein [Gluconobacter japonicus]|uniref:hypothetical protein n=1 Tax=Gluconobacter japonicus TaxID=376620 RepID=UPI0039E7D8BB
MGSAAPVAAGVILPSWLAIVLILVWAIVMVGVVIMWLRHHGHDRRIDVLERKDRADEARQLRMEQMVQTVVSGQQATNADLQNVKELLHTIIKGHMGNG